MHAGVALRQVEKHWTEKSLEEMSERDWRIFREDFNIAYKARGCGCKIYCGRLCFCSFLCSWSQHRVTKQVPSFRKQLLISCGACHAAAAVADRAQSSMALAWKQASRPLWWQLCDVPACTLATPLQGTNTVLPMRNWEEGNFPKEIRKVRLFWAVIFGFCLLGGGSICFLVGMACFELIL